MAPANSNDSVYVQIARLEERMDAQEQRYLEGQRRLEARFDTQAKRFWAVGLGLFLAVAGAIVNVIIAILNK